MIAYTCPCCQRELKTSFHINNQGNYGTSVSYGSASVTLQRENEELRKANDELRRMLNLKMFPQSWRMLGKPRKKRQ